MTHNFEPIDKNNAADSRQLTDYINLHEAILYSPDKIFYPLVAKRLSIPLSNMEIKQYKLVHDQREYWTIEFLRDSLMNMLAGVNQFISSEGKKIVIRKYYYQALRLWKWIPISKPAPEFVINLSDLTPRIALELRSLDHFSYNYVIRRAVGNIFENIDSKTYHRSIAKSLKVRLDK